MASSTQLSECVAKQLGLPEATVALHMRNIREAGLITQGGRGRSSARMTATDAAQLLITSAGSLNPKDSVEVVERYAGIEKTRRSKWKIGLVPKLDQLPKRHTFAEALTALIESAMANEILIENKDEVESDAILITLFWPWDGAKIQFYRVDEAEYRLDPSKYLMKPAEPYWLAYGAGFFLAPSLPPITPSIISKADFQQERKFTHRTIFALAGILGGNDDFKH
jgi:hypothetical protein